MAARTLTRVSADGLHVHRSIVAPLDVEIAGNRVWSFVPARDSIGGLRWRHIPWPTVLAPFLHGVGQVVVRDSAGKVLHDAEVAIDDSDVPLQVVDPVGRSLAVDKHHRLQVVWSSAGPRAQLEALDAAETALDVLDRAGVGGFLVAGTLLGAIRDGQLIAHDCDVDIGYRSTRRTMTGVALESYRLQRAFIEDKLETKRFSAAEFKAYIPRHDNTPIGIDVRAAFDLAGTLYLPPTVMTDASKVSLKGTRSAMLGDQAFPVPADAEALLEATYGPGWQTPDPSFEFEIPWSVERRLTGLIRGTIAGRKDWEAFHQPNIMESVPPGSSSLAKWAADRLPAGATVIDIGCGNGRDVLWLAEHGFSAIGLDHAAGAVDRATRSAGRRDLTATFDRIDLADTRQVLAWTAVLRRTLPDAILVRHLLEHLHPAAWTGFWRLVPRVLRGGGRLLLEVGPGQPDESIGRRNYLLPAVVPRRRVIAAIKSSGGEVLAHRRLTAAGEGTGDQVTRGERWEVVW